jgi:hypothetical protein
MSSESYCCEWFSESVGSGDQIWSSTAFKMIAEENTLTISVASDCGEKFINLFVCTLQ